MTTSPSSPGHASSTASATRTFAALVGISSLAVWLQGLWAGLFMSQPDTEPDKTPWLEVHAWCGKAAIGFALLATVWAFMRLRERHDLTFGALALTLLLVLEAYLGGLVVDESKDALTAVHVPLAMALMGLTVWLPLRARSRGRVA